MTHSEEILFSYIMELIFHFGFGTSDFFDASGESVFDAVSLLSHVLGGVLENVLDKLSHLHRGHSLVLSGHNVIMRVLSP